MSSILRQRNLNRKALLHRGVEEGVDHQEKMAPVSKKIMERTKKAWDDDDHHYHHHVTTAFGGVGVQNVVLNEGDGGGGCAGCCTSSSCTNNNNNGTNSCYRSDCSNNNINTNKYVNSNNMSRKKSPDCSRVSSLLPPNNENGCGSSRKLSSSSSSHCNYSCLNTDDETVAAAASYARLIGSPDDDDNEAGALNADDHHVYDYDDDGGGDKGNCTRIGNHVGHHHSRSRKSCRMKRSHATISSSSSSPKSNSNSTTATSHQRWSLFSTPSSPITLSSSSPSSMFSTSSSWMSSLSSKISSFSFSSTSSSSSSPSSSSSSSASAVSVLVKVLFWVLVFNYHLSVLEACPSPVCTCKWKGGKQTVECKNQALETLPDAIDPETQVLDISGNKLGVLPQDAFRRAGLLNLQRIHVRNSRLTRIDPGAFNELKNLVEIDLGDNLLTSVPSLALKATPFLRDLNLAGNPIQRIPKGGFEFVTQLVKLDLSRCQLVEIDPQAFAHLKLLESLKISSNRLTTLNNHTVKSLAQLHAMELHDNPWECDCRLRDLKLWIEKENIPHPVSPSCHTPPRLAGKKFSELPVIEFACPPSILEATPSTPRQVRVTEGDNATFECVIESIPSPEVRWYWYNRLIENNTLRKYIIFERESTSVLMMLNAMKKDEGVVYCLAENAAGSAEANFTLEILPQPTLQNILDTTQILVIILAIVAVLLVSLAVGIFLFLRQRRNRSAKPPEILATSTPVKPPRLNYEINPGSLVANGFKTKGDSTTDNPDLILETNTNGTYQETTVEDQSSNSELNWEQQSYRNMGYSTEYPPDYGLPIIHENSVYSDSSYYNVNVTPGLNMNGSATTATAAVMSGVWNKNKVGARITAPSSRDSPDEGYQEGYCGTDV